MRKLWYFIGIFKIVHLALRYWAQLLEKKHFLTSSFRSHLLNIENVPFAHHYPFPHTVALFLCSTLPQLSTKNRWEITFIFRNQALLASTTNALESKAGEAFMKWHICPWRTSWKPWKVYDWLSCGGKGRKVLSAGAELDSHLGNVIDGVEGESSQFLPSIHLLLAHVGNSSRNVSFKCGLEKILTDTYSRQWFLGT